MKPPVSFNLGPLAWGLSFLVSLLAIIAWGQDLSWQLAGLSNYRLFPIFGLLAFSLMWSMYVVGFIRRHFHTDKKELGSYYQILPNLILVLILLHPGLLVWQLWRDGFGLPPNSYFYHYVAPAARWAVLLSSTVWLIFLAYELKHWFEDKKWFDYIRIAADLGLIGIFFHALKLGTNLQHGWFRYVWLFYGLSLMVMVSDIYWQKYRL